MSWRSYAMLPGLIASSLLAGQQVVALKPLRSISIHVAEPSDMSLLASGHLLVVSDKGDVFELDEKGAVIRSVEEVAYDLEALCTQRGQWLVVDERSRQLIRLDSTDLHVEQRLTIPYAGGRNKGYEALVWDPLTQHYLLITEREPVSVFDLDTELHVVNERVFDRSIRDVASAVWHDGDLWLLSDMDRLVLRCDPIDLHIKQRFEVPVINPEGLAFNKAGEMLVLSDDRQRLYTFAPTVPLAH